ncbi:MAG: thiol reductant ABC exporter subunit CydD [Solirubrobacteraceae bacterium]
MGRRAEPAAGGPLTTGVGDRSSDLAANGRDGGAVRVDRRLMRESTAARLQLAAAAPLALFMAILAVAQAVLLAHVITAAAMAGQALPALTGSLIALAVVLAARALASGLFEFTGRVAAARVLAELRQRLVRQLLTVRPGRASGEPTGELAASAVQGVDSLEDYFAGYLPAMMLSVTVPVAVMVWVVPLDPVVAVIFAVTVPLLIVFMVLIGVGAASRTRRRWQALSLLSSHFLDVVRGMETLRAHRREQAQAATLEQVGERYRQETMGTLKLAFLSALVLELGAMIGTGMAAATIGVQLTGGNLHLQAGLTVLLLAPELYAPLRSVGQQFHASADGLAAAGRLLEVLDEPGLLSEAAQLPGPGAEQLASRPGAQERSGHASAVPDPRTQPLAFKDVSFAYPERPGTVVERFTLTVRPGELLVLTGPSGAGKSTLAALAMRLADPVTGAVSCGGIDLRTIDADRWRERVAWVPQRTRIFAGTLAENIALATPGATPGQIAAAATAAGLDELLSSLAAGVLTRVGDGGRRLSAGQAQRIALARAFLSDASLVVLDEPTANLDDVTATQIIASIDALAHGRTVFLISHDPRLIALADHTVTLYPVNVPARSPSSTAGYDTDKNPPPQTSTNQDGLLSKRTAA